MPGAPSFGWRPGDGDHGRLDRYPRTHAWAPTRASPLLDVARSGGPRGVETGASLDAPAPRGRVIRADFVPPTGKKTLLRRPGAPHRDCRSPPDQEASRSPAGTHGETKARCETIVSPSRLPIRRRERPVALLRVLPAAVRRCDSTLQSRVLLGVNSVFDFPRPGVSDHPRRRFTPQDGSVVARRRYRSTA
jgi:hypothetical protein